jgi:ferredoxin
MKITIDRERRRDHSNCASIAPKVFELDANFKSFIIDAQGDSDELILRAAKACPNLLLSLRTTAAGRLSSPDPMTSRATSLTLHRN